MHLILSCEVHRSKIIERILDSLRMTTSSMGNAFVDDPTILAAVTFFFATDGKSFVPILSIVPFIVQANVECLTYSSIYVFKRPSLSAGREFIDGILNKGGSGEGGGTGNDAMP
jgi:hypothetical protein